VLIMAALGIAFLDGALRWAPEIIPAFVRRATGCHCRRGLTGWVYRPACPYHG